MLIRKVEKKVMRGGDKKKTINFVSDLKYKKYTVMLTVSTKQFKDNPAIYFDQIDQGIEVFILSGKNKPYKIVPAADDDEDKALLAMAIESRANETEYTGIDEFINYMKETV